MTSIGALTVNSVLDKRAILSNSGIARRISIGSNWTTIRIGYRVAYTDCGYDADGHIQYVGMMSNPSATLTNGPQGNVTSHFVGLRWDPSHPWARISSPAQHYGGASVVFQGCKRIGSIDALSASAGSFRKSAVITNRFIEIIEITKGSPSYSIHSVGVNNGSGKTAGVIDIPDKQTLISAMENPNDMTYVYQQLNSELGTVDGYTSHLLTVAANESDGELNAVCITWNRTLFPLILSECFWNKLA